MLTFDTVQKHAWQKLRQESTTQKFYIINVVSILLNKGNNKITELRTILQKESPNS